MRLTSQCGLFQAWVEIEDVEQDIFLARHIAGQRERMEAYVVSQPGKSYTIDVDLKRYFDQRPTTSAISNEKPFDCMSIHFRIDGNLVSRTIGKSDYSCQRISGIGISASEERPFRFVEPNLTEDGGTTRRNDTCGEGVGLIELSLVQSRKEALTAHDDTTATEAQQKMSGKLGEGSKKLVSSVTTFGALRATMPVTTYTMQYKPGQSSSQPYVRLAFRYATKEVLQAMSIIPAPAAPTFAPDATPTPTLSTSAVSQIARDEIDVDGSDEEHGRGEGSETDEEDDPVVEAERMAAKAALEADEAVLRARKAKMHAEEIAAEAKKAARKRKRQQTQEKDDKAGDDKEKIQRKAQKRLKKLLDDAKKKDAAEIDLTVDD